MSILKNNEVKMSLGILTVLLMAFSAVFIFMLQSYTGNINQELIKQNIAVIGAVVKTYPEAETEIVKNFTGNYAGDYKLGRSIMKKYSYDENLNVEKNGFVFKELRNTKIKFYALVFGLAAVLISLYLMSFNRIYSGIRKISQGAEAVIEGNFRPIPGDTQEGDMGFLVSQFNTMTERLSENVEALKEEKFFLKRLITDISHQLKTPLASLIMFNDILKTDSTISELERKTFVNESKNQLDRMEWLIKNMLKMAKLEAGVVEFNQEPLPIINTIKTSINGLSFIAEEKNILIDTRGDENVIVKHDRRWTAEAFSNIIKNCIEHSRPGGLIQIRWEENSVFVQVEIKDNGVGIPKEELPKIFDRFYKGPDSSNPTNIGIGLYITKTVIEGQGGSIYAYSEPSMGTRFIIRLIKICD